MQQNWKSLIFIWIDNDTIPKWFFNFKEMFKKFFAKSYLLILLPLIVGCQNQNEQVFYDDYEEKEVIIKRMNVRCKKFAYDGLSDSPHDCKSFGYFVDDKEKVFSGQQWCPSKDDATCEAAERYGLYWK